MDLTCGAAATTSESSVGRELGLEATSGLSQTAACALGFGVPEEQPHRGTAADSSSNKHFAGSNTRDILRKSRGETRKRRLLQEQTERANRRKRRKIFQEVTEKTEGETDSGTLGYDPTLCA